MGERTRAFNVTHFYDTIEGGLVSQIAAVANPEKEDHHHDKRETSYTLPLTIASGSINYLDYTVIAFTQPCQHSGKFVDDE